MSTLLTDDKLLAAYERGGLLEVAKAQEAETRKMKAKAIRKCKKPCFSMISPTHRRNDGLEMAAKIVEEE